MLYSTSMITYYSPVVSSMNFVTVKKLFVNKSLDLFWRLLQWVVLHYSKLVLITKLLVYKVGTALLHNWTSPCIKPTFIDNLNWPSNPHQNPESQWTWRRSSRASCAAWSTSSTLRSADRQCRTHHHRLRNEKLWVKGGTKNIRMSAKVSQHDTKLICARSNKTTKATR